MLTLVCFNGCEEAKVMLGDDGVGCWLDLHLWTVLAFLLWAHSGDPAEGLPCPCLLCDVKPS